MDIDNNGDRPLAYIEKIASLVPIENADFLEIASIRGWNVVVKKGQYVTGDVVSKVLEVHILER